MPRKKSGRPRMFDKNQFLGEIEEGFSRQEACNKIGISIKTLEYHLRRDPRFRRLVGRTLEVLDDEKFKSNYGCYPEEFNPVNPLFEKAKTDVFYFVKLICRAYPRSWGPASSEMMRWLNGQTLMSVLFLFLLCMKEAEKSLRDVLS